MNAHKQLRIRPLPLVMAISLLIVGCSPLALVSHAGAAPFTQAFVRLDRLKAVTTTGGRVCAKPATASTEATVKVTFPTTGGTDYVVNATAANWTVTTTGLDTGQTAWVGIGTASNVTGKVVTFPSGDLVVGTLYCFNFSATSTLTTSSAAAAETTQGTIETFTSVPASIDKTTYSESIISDDQIVVNAIVPPSFTFVLSGNVDNFASNLSTSAVVSTAGKTVTLTTNAQAGWIVWVKDLNSSGGKGALNSVTAGNYKITSSSAVGSVSHLFSGTVGNEDYGLACTLTTDGTGGGTVSLNANYDGTTATKAGVLDPANFQPIASANGPAGSGTGDVITLKELANISGLTPAASDFTDTITVIGAGVF